MEIGFALTGSFCTINNILKQVKQLSEKYHIVPIVSEIVASTDTRFIPAKETLSKLEEYTGNKVIQTIATAEPIGPQKLLDALVVAPCTGNTLSKIANGITDTTVSMAVKAQLRNEKPVILAISTNDGLSGSAPNIGNLLNKKHIYFVPYVQDDCINKPTSLVADFSKLDSTIEQALQGKQIQPLF